MKFPLLFLLLASTLSYAQEEAALANKTAAAVPDAAATVTAETIDCVQVTRIEIHDYTPEQRERYFAAVKKSMERRGNRPSKYDLLVKKHNDLSSSSHGVPAFLPWHRLFIREFEAMLQEIDPEVTLPYWAWEEEAGSPELSNVFLPDWFGGNGNPRRGNCVTDGPQAGWVPFYPSGARCVTRKFNRDDRIGAFAFPERISQLIDENDSYASFRKALEGPTHFAVHNGLGANFKSMHSPSDLVFWLHHGNIDRIWDKWQRVKPARRYSEYGGPKASANDQVRGYGKLRIRDALSMKVSGACITYATPVNIRKKKSGNSRAEPSRKKRSEEREPSRDEEDGHGRHKRVRGPVTVHRRPRHHSRRLHRRSLNDDSHDSHHHRICLRKHTLTRAKDYQNSVRSDDRSNVMDLHYMDEIPEDLLRMNNQDVEYVRKEEAATRRLVDQLNELPGYVSPAALINDQSKLARLASQGVKFGAWNANGSWVRSHGSSVDQIKRTLSQHGVPVNGTLSQTIRSSLQTLLGRNAVKTMQKAYHDYTDTVWYTDAPEYNDDKKDNDDEEKFYSVSDDQHDDDEDMDDDDNDDKDCRCHNDASHSRD